MKALVLTSYKKPLTVGERPEPVVGPHDVLIDVHAAGLNQLDEKLRAGDFTQLVPLALPATLGHDVAGVVAEVGSEVRSFAPGDPVYGRVRDGRIGTFAERVAADESDLAHVPAALTMVEAASLPLVALTAWQALVVRTEVRPGQKVLIHAGAGGVGSIAIQLAKHLGARVATTASAANAEFVASLGADVVIDYRSEDFEQQLTGYDVVLDSVGGENLMKSLRVLRPGGRAVGLAGPPDPAFARQLGLNPVLRAGIAAISRSVRHAARTAGVDYSFLWMSANGDQLREISGLVESGAIRPIVGRVVSFDAIPEALAGLGKTGVRGKVVAAIPSDAARP
ncbi:NADP-dependent oxidoreductase [Leifsonia shinshuensis]|uniref:NADP-dependent oxidoreductase n=1 Tax=Leifsonia shinshuensis TaxID=150026 RepID=UPI001F50DD9B|nr:NADP-dependent oxidoreductase [Leifsonia shinshuensis]MCI0157097.1 NADP-dependent oxidoreductase [Leifsonia shinshuensis]